MYPMIAILYVEEKMDIAAPTFFSSVKLGLYSGGERENGKLSI